MANLEAKHFFTYHRFPENELKILLAIVYLPLGIIILLLRSVLGLFLIIFGQVLPDSQLTQKVLNNLACVCFGITVSVENSKQKENVNVYISNYLSVFDHLALRKALGFVLPLNKTPLESLPGLGITNIGSVSNTETFKKNLETVTSKKLPVLLEPEETPTNGKALLKFNSKYFEFFEKVQPLCIAIKRPFLDISLSTITSTYLNDIFYFMYSPFTNYTIKFLPSLEKKSLSGEEFADIVRDNIATELKVEKSSLSASDLLEWSKRHIMEERRRAQDIAALQSSTSIASNPELARMSAQVKEVLPHVPLGTIYNDLTITRSIDTTITNILEGRVRFIPETQRSTSSASSAVQPSTSTSSTTKSACSSVSTAQPSALLNTSASSFGKNANERTKSFKERKEQLIAAARRRYIEKHNLDIPL